MIGLGGASPVSDLVSEPMEDSMALIARLVLPACREFSGTLPALGHIFSDEGHRLPFRPSTCGHASALLRQRPARWAAVLVIIGPLALNGRKDRSSRSKCHAGSKHRPPSSSRSWRIHNATRSSTGPTCSREPSLTRLIAGVGDNLTMRMSRLGRLYLMTNYAVEFEPDRRIC